MARGVSLKFELYGSAAAGEKGYWRWVIFSASNKKPLEVGSFFGAFPDAEKNAQAAVLRLKERIQKQRRQLPKTP